MEGKVSLLKERYKDESEGLMYYTAIHLGFGI